MIGLWYRDGTKDVVLEEALKTEGVPYRRLREPSAPSDLLGLVAGEGCEAWSSELLSFVSRGGSLLVVKPVSELAEGLGLKLVGRQLGGYLAVEGGEASEACSYNGELQLFGEAYLYEGGETLARLRPEERYGGVIRVRLGLGCAIVAAFDVAETVLTIQQPSSECGKAIDASVVERRLSRVPQLDVMRRLLINLFLKEVRAPVPRKWYFPRCSRALLVLSGDQDGAPFEQLAEVLRLIQELQVPYTLFATPSPHQPVTREQFERLMRGGMDLALHPNFFRGGGSRVLRGGEIVIVKAESAFAEEELVRQLRDVEERTGAKLAGCRCHGLRWETALDLPLWLERAGLQYDSTLGARLYEDVGFRPGYYVGTGLPYRFVDTRTYRVVDVLELPMITGDQVPLVRPRLYVVALKPGAVKKFRMGGLTEEETFELLKEMLDDSVSKYHTALCLNFHPIYLASRRLNIPGVHHSDRLFRMIVTYAKSLGVGVMSANQWNEFWRNREAVTIEDLSWRPELGRLSFTVRCAAGGAEVTLLIPKLRSKPGPLVLVGGARTEGREMKVLGWEYVAINVYVGRKPIMVEALYGG